MVSLGNEMILVEQMTEFLLPLNSKHFIIFMNLQVQVYDYTEQNSRQQLQNQLI